MHGKRHRVSAVSIVLLVSSAVWRIKIIIQMIQVQRSLCYKFRYAVDQTASWLIQKEEGMGSDCKLIDSGDALCRYILPLGIVFLCAWKELNHS
ncbi:hypothetical protein EJB05_16173, partial [Eragrostis curvula]